MGQVATPPLQKARDLLDHGRLSRSGSEHSSWSRASLSGLLTELVGGPSSANLSVASRLILDAQAAGEMVAWIATHRDVFFPPDLAVAGIDLAALPVVWAEEPTAVTPGDGTKGAGGTAGTGNVPITSAAIRRRKTVGRAIRAAEQLLRSEAFGLIIIDLAKDLSLPAAGQGRLLRLAEHYNAQVLIVRRKREDGIYSGSLVTVRTESTREMVSAGRFRCTITNTKDKREGPGWTTTEMFDGPPGLY